MAGDGGAVNAEELSDYQFEERFPLMKRASREFMWLFIAAVGSKMGH